MNFHPFKTFFLFWIVFVLLSGGSHSSLAANDTGFQLWTDLKYSHKFKPSKFTLHWAMENRFQDGTDHFLFNTTLGFYYDFFTWFKAGMFYRVEKKEGNDWENRPMPQFEFTLNAGPIEINDRNRFEFRIFPDDFRFRYRNRLKISHLFDTSPVSFTPYLSDEVFFETEKGGFNENRFIVGNEFGFCKNHIQWGLYYMLRLKEDSSKQIWNTAHILGVTLGFKY